jgi:hypothetical protein
VRDVPIVRRRWGLRRLILRAVLVALVALEGSACEPSDKTNDDGTAPVNVMAFYSKSPSAPWHGLERRHLNRPVPESCRVCGAPAATVTVTHRTAYFVFFKCERCRNVWTIDIPALPAPKHPSY